MSHGTTTINPGMMPGTFGDDPADMGGANVNSNIAGSITLFVMFASVAALGLGADAQRVMLTACISLSLYSLLNLSPAAGIPATLFYLGSMGALRRYIIPILGYASYDPFLVVAPIVVTLMFLIRISRRDIPRDTPLSKAMAALLFIMFLEIFNPLQGGLATGITGALFYIVPMLWFYVGRSFGTPVVVRNLLLTAAFIGVATAGYGLYQQFVGFTDIEKEWIAITKNDRGQYLAEGTMRVFSTFSSFAEYVMFAVACTTICLAYAMRKNRLMFLPLAFLFLAVVLSSSRGALLTATGGCAFVWAILGNQPRLWIPRIAVAVVIGISALFIGLSNVKTEALDDTSRIILQHQQNGILGAADKQASTGSGHLRQSLNGIMRGFQNPLGYGLGVTTVASGKTGGEQIASESDIGDTFIACGFIGGLIYAFIIGYSAWLTTQVWHRYRDVVWLAAFGVLMSTIGFWVSGARYALPMMVWFLIGSADRIQAQWELAKQNAPENARFKKSTGYTPWQK
jgi:hypothetical protein